MKTKYDKCFKKYNLKNVASGNFTIFTDFIFITVKYMKVLAKSCLR